MMFDKIVLLYSSGVLATVLAATHPIQQTPSQVQSTFKLVCYISNFFYSNYYEKDARYSLKSIDTDQCTHIIYGIGKMNDDEIHIEFHEFWTDFDEQFGKQVSTFKQRGIKVFLAVDGRSIGETFSQIASGDSNRARFIDHAVDFLKKHNFDGLDLPWFLPVGCREYYCIQDNATTKEDFYQFFAKLAEAFDANGLQLSAAAGAIDDTVDNGYDLNNFLKHLQWLTIKTTNMDIDDGTDKTGYSHPIRDYPGNPYPTNNINHVLDSWKRHVNDTHKLAILIPFISDAYHLVDPAEHGLNADANKSVELGEHTTATGFISYYEVCKKINTSDGWQIISETDQAAKYAYKDDQWFSIEDADTVRAKAALVREQNLFGAVIYSLNDDDIDNDCGHGKHPLLNAVRSALLGSKL